MLCHDIYISLGTWTINLSLSNTRTHMHAYTYAQTHAISISLSRNTIKRSLIFSHLPLFLKIKFTYILIWPITHFNFYTDKIMMLRVCVYNLSRHNLLSYLIIFASLTYLSRKIFIESQLYVCVCIYVLQRPVRLGFSETLMSSQPSLI